jgi:hypothetical protein
LRNPRRTGHPLAVSHRVAALLFRERGHERLLHGGVPASGPYIAAARSLFPNAVAGARSTRTIAKATSRSRRAPGLAIPLPIGPGPANAAAPRSEPVKSYAPRISIASSGFFTDALLRQRVEHNAHPSTDAS